MQFLFGAKNTFKSVAIVDMEMHRTCGKEFGISILIFKIYRTTYRVVTISYQPPC